MASSTQVERARHFRTLHERPTLLLANVWDPIGALLLEDCGLPAVATASAAVAWSNGVDDGELLPFARMLTTVEAIANAVTIPVTADIERGYADEPAAVADNVARIIDAGAVGINIEDSTGDALVTIEDQCHTLRAVRARADRSGVPLYVNARIDVWLHGRPASEDERLADTIERARAYLDAGADGVYPIGLADRAALERLRSAIDAPINVYLSPSTPPLDELARIGIERLSVGPGLLKVALGAMRSAVAELRESASYERFFAEALTSAEVRDLLNADSRTASGRPDGR